ARYALAHAEGAVAVAYAHLSVELDWRRFGEMFDTFHDRRGAIAAHFKACGDEAAVARDVWVRCGFDAPVAPEALEAEAVARTRWGQWRRAAEALAATGRAPDAELG